MYYKTIKETALMFSVSEMTVRRWISDGKLKVLKVGRSVRIPISEIEKLEKGE